MGKKSSSQSNSTASTVNNIDRRNAVQDGVGVSGDGNSVQYVSNDTDVVRAIAQLGTDAIKLTGGAIVDMTENNARLNAEVWGQTLTQGTALVDRMLDSVQGGFALANKAVESYQPNDNKNSNTMMYLGMGAIGLLAVSFLAKK